MDARHTDTDRTTARGPGARARQLHRRAVRRATVRRLRRRRDQDRGARRRPDATLGGLRRRLEPVVADHRPQQALGGRRPARIADDLAFVQRTRRASAMWCWRTSGRACSRSSASTTTAVGRQPRCHRHPRLGLRSDRSTGERGRDSGRSAKLSAASATPPVIPTDRRRVAASASATRSPPCSP